MKAWKWIWGMLLLSSLSVTAQTDVQLSQHMFNRMNYNPAVTGASRFVNVTASGRNQWVGWEGAPKSQMVTVHSFFNAVNSGFGLTLLNDKIGYETSLSLKLSYAYHVQLSENAYLSLGLSAGAIRRSYDYEKVNIGESSDDEMALLGLVEKTRPDFDFGAELNTGKFTIGLSVTHLAQRKMKTPELMSGRHYYLFAKYIVPVHYRWKVIPSLFVQANKATGHDEINVLALLDDRYWVGASFRMNDRFKAESFVPMLGVDITKVVRVGYSYDVNLWRLSRYSSGTHELLLSIRISKKSARYSKSPRFFE